MRSRAEREELTDELMGQLRNDLRLNREWMTGLLSDELIDFSAFEKDKRSDPKGTV